MFIKALLIFQKRHCIKCEPEKECKGKTRATISVSFVLKKLPEDGFNEDIGLTSFEVISTERTL